MRPIGNEQGSDRLLTTAEAAKVLGLAPSTVYLWAAQRRIESVHLGRSLRFRESAIQRLIRDSTVSPLASR